MPGILPGLLVVRKYCLMYSTMPDIVPDKLVGLARVLLVRAVADTTSVPGTLSGGTCCVPVACQGFCLTYL